MSGGIMKKDTKPKEETKKSDGYIQVTNSFMFHQMDLKGSAVKVFLALLYEGGDFGRNKKIKISNYRIRYLTGIRDEETIRKGIRELARKGWIQGILADIDNSYTYIITTEKKKTNFKLLEWLDSVSEKRSEKTKTLMADRKIVRGEKGRFTKTELPKEGFENE